MLVYVAERHQNATLVPFPERFKLPALAAYLRFGFFLRPGRSRVADACDFCVKIDL